MFYQLDLDDAAREMNRLGVPMPAALPDDAPIGKRFSDAMFRSHLSANSQAATDSHRAFARCAKH